MRLGKELIGKPIYSLTDGRHLGSVKDLYLDHELETLVGLYLGSEGLFSRRANVISSENVAVLGVDAVLASGPDVVSDSNELPEVAGWLRREDLQGRNVDTPGGTKVGTVGDVLLDEAANVVGFVLARVYVEGPIAETRQVLKSAVIDGGALDGIMTLDLAKAEQPSAAAGPADEPVEDVAPIDELAPAEELSTAEDAEVLPEDGMAELEPPAEPDESDGPDD